MDEDKTGKIATFHQSVEEGDVGNCRKYLKEWPQIVHTVNKKQESALHIVCKRKNTNNIIELILAYSPDVNSRNFWGQTPLHYAASNKSLKMIKRLLTVEGVDVNTIDVNGYNALHSLIMCGQRFDEDFQESIQLLLQSNVDILAKTFYRQTVLHLAAIQGFMPNIYMEPGLLLYLLQFSQLDIMAKNIMGENILHSCNAYSVNVSDFMHLIDLIFYKLDEDLPKRMLNDKDKRGLTPFFNRIIAWPYFEKKNDKHLARLIHVYGASMKGSDNLGNTLLHYVMKEESLYKAIPYILKHECFNVQNMFGETPLFYLKLKTDEQCEAVFSHEDLNFQIRDRWGRTPLFNIITAEPFWHKLEPLLQKLDADDVNTTDKFGSTLLHLAAYLTTDGRSAGQWQKVLVNYTKASMGKKDKEGDTPFQTALKHGNFLMLNMIAKMTNRPVDPSVITYRAKGCISLSALELHEDIRDLIKDFPSDIYRYVEEMLNRKHVITESLAEMKTEEFQIVEAVQEVVKKICNNIAEYDPRFRMTFFPTGSTSEGTKVGRPDEFDFGLCLEQFEERCDIETFIDETDSKPYAKLKLRNDNLTKEYLPFCDEEYYLRVLPLLMYLFRYLNRALFENDIWTVLGFLKELTLSREKPVFTFSVVWVGSKYKYLPISVDLVPVVYRPGWWPTNIDSLLSSKVLFTEPVRTAGCFVLLKNKSFDFDIKCATCMNDDINMACNTTFRGSVDDKKLLDQRLLLISICPAEIALMKSLPRNYRQAYALAKMIKDPGVCPDVIVDVLPNGIEIHRYEHYHHVVRPFECIKSYWLKNCMFYLAENDVGKETFDSMKPLDITKNVYHKLLEFTLECSIHPYLLPQTDVFELEKKKEFQTKEVTMFLLERKVCVDMVMRLLGCKVSTDNTEWLQSAPVRYTHHAYSPDEVLGSSIKPM